MITREELQARRTVAQEKMQTLNLDGLLLLQNISMYYFSGTMQCSYVFIPAAGECLGLVRKNYKRAKLEAGIPVAAIDRFSDVPAKLAEAGFKVKRLGLEMDVVPVKIYFQLQKVLPETEFLDAGILVREVRQKKSAFELKQLRLAAKQIDALHKKIPDLLEIGKKEIVFAAECEAFLRKLGHQGFTRMRGFNEEMYYGHILSGAEGAEASFVDSPTGGKGLSPVMPYGAGEKTLAANEPITVDYGGIHGGYVVDQPRLYSFGKLPDLLRRGFEAALEVQETVKKLLYPGTTGADIFAAALETAKKLGLAEHFMGFGRTQASFVGHGVGLEVNEFPILAKNSPHIIIEDTVVAVEPKFTFPGAGVVGLENTWQVTKNGPVKISLTADEHVIL